MENMEMTYEQRHAREYEKVSLREQICYGLGDSACNVVYGLCSTLLTFFYTDYVGVNPLTVGMVFLITRVFDGISDLIMGFITDRTKSKWGNSVIILILFVFYNIVASVTLYVVYVNPRCKNRQTSPGKKSR